MPDEKLIYQFTVSRQVEKTVEEKSTDESGAEIIKKTKKTVDEPINVIIKRPNRRQDDLAEERYAVEFSRMLKSGMLTKAMLANKYSDCGGMMSESDAKDYAKLIKDLSTLKDDYQKQASFAKGNKKKEKAVEELGEKVLSTTREVLAIEQRYQNLFELTAESKAEVKRTLWYALNLTFLEEDGKRQPLYVGETFEEKQDSYYEKEDGDDVIYNQIRQKLWLVFAVWNFNRNLTPEEIGEMLKTLENSDGQ